MDKRKLIGTIIGVTMFGALIVGATYAWLSFNATVTNAAANGRTLNYIVNYTKGTNISDIPILGTPTTSTASLVTVKAQKPAGSIADNITISLTTTSTGLTTTSGVVKYVICEGACDANFSGNTINSVTATSTVDIYTGTLPGTATTSGTEVTYNIYFWIDAATLTNDHLTTGNNQYAGYIHAKSTQSTTNYG